MVQLGVAPIRVGILTSLTGVTWEEAFVGKAAGFYGDVPVNFLGRERLVASKSALGRKKDLADLEAMGEERPILAHPFVRPWRAEFQDRRCSLDQHSRYPRMLL